MIIHDLLLFLDARGIHTPQAIRVQDNDDFVKSFYGLSPKGIETKLCLMLKVGKRLDEIPDLLLGRDIRKIGIKPAHGKLCRIPWFMQNIHGKKRS